ncbi:hypothetical protein LXT21_40435 [Myxococcus sp. K38C18041901]|uniref:RING finger protein n=1 Tax=Myxococcus guangdongensis TaxID=2906760 RepID=UPI0020A810FE|nr:RING finger protein [Myxococcus guangdongensis]MCP3065059.1 hypothetical protein [Myxococcus guangdongensis]
MSALEPRPTAAYVGHTCGICQTDIATDEQVGTCPACEAPFHAECWAENGGCAQYGCLHMPSSGPREPPALGHAYWGQEEKACTECGQQIKVAALRCRHCGAVFASDQPMTAAEVETQEQVEARRAAVGTTALWLFIAGLVPCTAPLALVVGGVWFLRNRAAIRRLPSQRRVMAWLGLGVAAAATLLFVVVGLFFGAET